MISKLSYLLPLGILALLLALVIPYLWVAGFALLGYWMLASVLDMLTGGADGAAIVLAGVIAVALMALVIV